MSTVAWQRWYDDNQIKREWRQLHDHDNLTTTVWQRRHDSDCLTTMQWRRGHENGGIIMMEWRKHDYHTITKKEWERTTEGGMTSTAWRQGDDDECFTAMADGEGVRRVEWRGCKTGNETTIMASRWRYYNEWTEPLWRRGRDIACMMKVVWQCYNDDDATTTTASRPQVAQFIRKLRPLGRGSRRDDDGMTTVRLLSWNYEDEKTTTRHEPPHPPR